MEKAFTAEESDAIIKAMSEANEAILKQDKGKERDKANKEFREALKSK